MDKEKLIEYTQWAFESEGRKIKKSTAKTLVALYLIHNPYLFEEPNPCEEEVWHSLFENEENKFKNEDKVPCNNSTHTVNPLNFVITTRKNSTPHRCPVCNGTGTVPYGFYLQISPTSVASFETCRQCKGEGYIWSKD